MRPENPYTKGIGISDGIIELDFGSMQRIAWQNGFDACMKWLEEPCADISHYWGIGGVQRKDCKQCWQELKLEVKNDKD